MAKYPEAEWQPLDLDDPKPMARYDVVCVHTMEGYLKGTDRWFRNGAPGTSSHFGVGGPADGELEGVVYQWVDTDTRAAANFQGNPRVISIETGDGGKPETPWSEKQINALENLIAWCCREHSIPTDTSGAVTIAVTGPAGTSTSDVMFTYADP